MAPHDFAQKRGDARRDVVFFMMYSITLLQHPAVLLDLTKFLLPLVLEVDYWLETAVGMFINCVMFDWVLKTQFLPYAPQGFLGSAVAWLVALMATFVWTLAYERALQPPVHVTKCRTMSAVTVSIITALRIDVSAAMLSFAFVDLAVPSDCLPFPKKRPAPSQCEHDARKRRATVAERATVENLQRIGDDTAYEILSDIKERTGMDLPVKLACRHCSPYCLCL